MGRAGFHISLFGRDWGKGGGDEKYIHKDMSLHAPGWRSPPRVGVARIGHNRLAIEKVCFEKIG